jgi:hypothetical protein
MPSELRFHNLDIAIEKIRSIGGGAEAYMAQLVRDAMHEDVWPQWVAHISLNDHTLEDLRKLGHPYSTRYGADSFMHKDEDVHIQSGDLLNASHIVEVRPGVMHLINTAREYVFLRFGTSKMRPRDPGAAALRDALPAIKKRFAEGVKNAIIKYVSR